MNTLVTALDAPTAAELSAQLRHPVRATLAARAARLRATLPPRPDAVAARYGWWRSLDAEQARRAALLDRLDELCDQLDAEAAPELLPAAVLEEAEGFNPGLTRIIAAYRAAANLPAA